MDIILKKIIKDIILDIDLSKYKPQIQKGIKLYFESSSFYDDFIDAMTEENIGCDLGILIAKKLTDSKIFENIEVSFSKK